METGEQMSQFLQKSRPRQSPILSPFLRSQSPLKKAAIRLSTLLALSILALASPKAEAQAGLGLEVGGGVSDYTRGLGPGTDVGPAWGAQMNVMPTPVLGIELGYLGSHVNYSGDAGSGSIAQNGGSASLRVNVLTGRVQPFLFGGIGASRLSADSSVPVESETLLDIPAGAGLQVNITDRFNLSGRFRYNFQFDTDFGDAVTDPSDADVDRQGFDRWIATLNIGTHL